MESTAIALEGPDPFASCDQAGARREYEQIIGCSPTLKVVLPETGARRTDRLHGSGRAGDGWQFSGRVSGRNVMATACNTGQLERDREVGRIVGSSRALESALALVERVAPTQSAVLLLGETGSGQRVDRTSNP